MTCLNNHKTHKIGTKIRNQRASFRVTKQVIVSTFQLIFSSHFSKDNFKKRE